MAEHQWHILGVGAIGGLFARRLKNAGAAVTLLSRQQGCSLRTLEFVEGGDVTQVTFATEHVDDPSPISHLLVCTKSHSALNAVDAVATRLQPNAVVVIASNGMGVDDQLSTRHPGVDIAVATTTSACFRDDRGRWHPVATGATQVGWPRGEDAAQPDWWSSWQRGVPGAEWSADMPALQRRKLAINAVINPATALHNVNNGGLLSDTLRDEAMLACNEVADILRSIGDAALADQVHDIVTRVARETAANTSSMRADVMAGRGTEVEAILGYLLEYLKAQAQAPVATPLLDNWLQRLRNYEQERLRLPD